MGCFSGQTTAAELLRALDHESMQRCISLLTDEYGEGIACTELTRSVLGRQIPILRLGCGEKSVLYVGTHHGMEWLTSSILLYFLDDLCDCARQGRNAFGLSVEYILKMRTLLFVPMLNPDGVELVQKGATVGGILSERQIRMNGGSHDFSRWQANARGVDLNHNYRYGFAAYKQMEREMNITGGARSRFSGESPESEPESGALASFIRTVLPHAIYTLHTQGEEIYCGGESAPENVLSIGRALAGLSGYKLCIPEGAAAYGGLTDYAVCEMGIPSFTVECGRGENPLPPSSFLLIYAALRRMLFYSTLL